LRHPLGVLRGLRSVQHAFVHDAVCKARENTTALPYGEERGKGREGRERRETGRKRERWRDLATKTSGGLRAALNGVLRSAECHGEAIAYW
jgi:hypothetical protein